MENNWYTIWNRRNQTGTFKSTLASLIAADGFDTAYGGIEESAWMEYVQHLTAKLEINRDDSIFEVGCGAGAFLYPFYQQGNPVAGIDYSENLVKIAKDTMPKVAISVGEAIDISGKSQFNVVLSNGVFLYFPNYDYAGDVLQSMVKIAKKSIGIFEIPDLGKKQEALKMRKGMIGDAEYEEKYRGLDHLYFSKDWFQEVLAAEGVRVKIEDQDIPGYGNSQYRFNVFIYKI
ncbi:MAG TPA: class I SAM-dependent methyltransferase [Cyanobacteria bacterium UBA11149]|nr:class I SAM-dependent methyltransferase [Cyanobacteria bacterium UBA11367]HBE57945.1 class I SAM-dependent methyltransferase [Cyanobacteria bacterium UBA11366]HBK62866.1 class I SAM-dependent methyltransferase [Cyanobacteria bacterium UBA11166]HBR76018.1 class I SAM-dependent methyltransferase [Cyanobacteria bacterium UBA11159]HBS71030.1 class I SAM-dependent methyltransferase [Cyanobacteria bacterium UBA11153]HBW90874.1 class I SAM-dependent methyltransferase [Cyanobacteria bacterium UBA11